MSPELFWLTLTTIMTGLFWLPYILDRIAVRGLRKSMDYPQPNDKPQSPWAQRQMRAHKNAIENLVLFATLVLTLRALGISTATTALACAVYFWARLAHFLICTAGIPVARTLAFAVGFAAQAVLALAIFKLV